MDLNERVTGIDEKLDRLSTSVDERFDELRNLIVDEGRTTRRHFEIVAEQMKSERNLATDERLTRLTELEKPQD